MKWNKSWLVMLLCLLLCGCGQNKVASAPPSGSQNTPQKQISEPVPEGSAQLQDVSPEGYQQEYYTSEETLDAQTIHIQTTPEEGDKISANREQEDAVREYAGCLYPDHTPSLIEVTSRKTDGNNYVFFAVKDENGTIFCTIAYDTEHDIFYLYDSEVEQLIPIEYDEYGVRLVS